MGTLALNSTAEARRDCPVCHSAPSGIHQRIEGGTYWRCSKCRSLYLGASPSESALAGLYTSIDYAEQRGHTEDEAVAACKAATTSAYLRMLRDHAPPGRRYLEVGCSAGIALATAAAEGWESHGVEVSAGAAAAARQRPGVRSVHAGTVLEAEFPSGGVDVVTLFDVIEHIDPPLPTLRRIYDLLADGGLILLVTPDGDSPSARLLGARWPHLFPEHVVCFSRDALVGLLVEVGFEILDVAFAWKRVNLNMLVRHARLHPETVGAGLLARLGGLLPAALANAMLPFNIGEFYVIARRPSRPTRDVPAARR